MSGVPQKAEWIIRYDDGNDKATVSYDTTSKHCPDSIRIEFSSDQWVYIDAQDAPWFAARLIDAAVAINDAVLTGREKAS